MRVALEVGRRFSLMKLPIFPRLSLLAFLVAGGTLQPHTADGAEPVQPVPAPAPRRVLAMAFAGIHSFTSPSAYMWEVGTRLGGLVGYRIQPWFSVDGELTLDLLDPVDDQAAILLDKRQADFALSPLFHLRMPRWELALGPKLGRFWSRLDLLLIDQGRVHDRNWGWVAGLNAGAFVRLPRSISAGLFASYVVRVYDPSCRDYPDGTTSCNQGTPPSDSVASLSAAVLY
jgi:hypothetical protein